MMVGERIVVHVMADKEIYDLNRSEYLPTQSQ